MEERGGDEQKFELHLYLLPLAVKLSRLLALCLSNFWQIHTGLLDACAQLRVAAAAVIPINSNICAHTEDMLRLRFKQEFLDDNHVKIDERKYFHQDSLRTQKAFIQRHT